MSFGDSGDHDGPSAEAMLAWSRRMSAPENELPASYPFTAVLGRTDDVAVALLGAHVYSTGFSVELVVRLRTAPRGVMSHRLFDIISGHGLGAESAEERLLLGVEYEDGRTATNVDRFGWPGAESPPADDALVLSPSGGGGGGRTYEQSFWVSPVPPAGAVTFVCSWPAFGIAESRAVLDATALQAAAGRSALLWPPSPPDDDMDEPPEPPDVPDGWFSRALGRRHS